MQSITSFVLSLVLGQCFAQWNPWDAQARQGDSGWLEHHQQLLQQTAQHKADAELIFIGDSITEGWGWGGTSGGTTAWTKTYTPRHAYNYGIAGDVTQNVIYRIQNKEFDGLNPKVTVLMIGTNNLNGNTVEDTTKGIKKILTELLAKMPSTKIILLGILPRAEPLGGKAKQLNTLIAKLGDNNNVFWLDMWNAFTTNGQQNTQLYVTDKLHLNSSGYDVWQKTMEPTLAKLLA